MGAAVIAAGSFPAPPSLRARALRGTLVTLGLLACLVFVTLPMEPEEQAILTIGGILAFLALNRMKSRRIGLVLVVMSISISARYLFWRATETLEFETLPQIVLGGLLFMAELYAGLLMALSYLQTSWPLDRKPVPLPADPAVADASMSSSRPTMNRLTWCGRPCWPR